MIIGTIACAADLPNVLLMAISAKRHMPDAEVTVCLVEEQMPPPEQHDWYNRYVDRIVLAKDIHMDRFYSHMFKFEHFQYATAIKGAFMRYLLESNTPGSKLIYLDAHMYVTAPFHELLEMLDRTDIVLVPHHLEPSPADDYKREQGILRDGTFHGGLLAVRYTDEGITFARWWEAAAMSDYKDYYDSKFLDQKWLNLVPCLFHCAVLRHPGYNVAFWNLHESGRHIRKLEDGSFTSGTSALRSFNFTDFSGLLDKCLSSFVPDGEAPIYNLREQYMNQLGHFKNLGFETGWSYNTYFNGESIYPQSRQIYAASVELVKKYVNPFHASNENLLRSGES